jgi:hypothetical protein
LQPTQITRTSQQVAKDGLLQFSEITRQKVTPSLIRIWEETLQDVQAELLSKALLSLLRTWESGFLPTPGNVRKRVEAILAKEKYSNNHSLVNEWESAKKRA